MPWAPADMLELSSCTPEPPAEHYQVGPYTPSPPAPAPVCLVASGTSSSHQILVNTTWLLWELKKSFGAQERTPGSLMLGSVFPEGRVKLAFRGQCCCSRFRFLIS